MSHIMPPQAVCDLIAYGLAHYGFIDSSTVNKSSYELHLNACNFLMYEAELLEDYVTPHLDYQADYAAFLLVQISFYEYQIDWSPHKHSDAIKDMKKLLHDDGAEDFCVEEVGIPWGIESFNQLPVLSEDPVAKEKEINNN